jgi:transposase
MDVHKVKTQICVCSEDGEIFEQSFRTTRERLSEVLGARPRARILLEAATESEWVARWLEDLGHEVIVADPNFAPMYATLSRRIKTDRRDARALMEACVKGNYRAAHRLSDPQRRVRAQLAARANLVQARVRLIGVVRALLRQHGLRVSPGIAESFGQRVGSVEKPGWLTDTLRPLLVVFDSINHELKSMDRAIRKLVSDDPIVRRLNTAPGVGPVTAAAFVATIDQVQRFKSARQVRSYLGLVPSESSSAERHHRGGITKTGNGRMRSLLVEAAWCVLHTTRDDAECLRSWARQIALRRGRQIAVVALARRLAGILYAMWRDERDFVGDPRSAELAAGSVS